ncbi:hypothetical protein MUN74_03320 [Agromyces endophyticus]|uniref:hypothetical protein n=1 Tax=Agromyces sp. H17E-10 TaxID=2932244 RepID=UPI001FD2D612|nr:hypothetical protein [Agromyces sp. H17E-10]UOQ89964.1 hypothetical protein MUN74_03320 [Agromyces sp. H17E-10]
MRLTQQEADPIGAITAAPIVVIGAVLSFGTSLALTWVHRAEIVAPAAAIASIVLVAAAGVVAAISAAPSRAPFTAERLWLVVTLAVGAAIAEYMSTVGSNQYLYDDFGPVVIGMLILSVAPFCTWLSLALAGVLASIVLSILVVGASAYVLADAPVAALIAINAAPVIALTAAAAGYAYAIIAETLAWQREANRAALQRDAELRAGIARSVQQSRVSVLGREVLPFLAGVMTAERISVADADRARELAEELRRALRAGIESTWLDDLAANLRVSRGVETFVDDPTGAADLLGDDQRSALTALITWLAETGRSERVGVSFAPEPGGGLIRIVADPSGRPPAKRELDRFVAVARAVALGAESVSTRENVSVELRYVIE